MRIKERSSGLFSLLFLIIGEWLIWSPKGFLSQLSIFQTIDQFIRPGISNFGEAATGFLLIILAIILLVKVFPKNARANRRVRLDAPKTPLSLLRNIAVLLTPYVFFLFALGKGEYFWFFPLIWLVIPILIGLSFFQSESRIKNPFAAVSERVICTVLGIFFLAFLIVSYRLATFPAMVMGDEPAFFMRAKTISEGNEKGTIFDSGVYTFPLLGNLYQGLFLLLGGPTILAWRLSSVFAATITLFPLFFLVKAWTGNHLSVLTCLLMTTLPYFLTFSRLGYTNIHAVPIVVSIVALLYKASLRKELSTWYFVGMLSGLGFYSYSAAQIGALIALFYIIALVAIRKCSLKSAGRIVLCLMLGFLLIYAPYVIRITSITPELLSHKWAESIFFNTWNKDVYFADIAATKTDILGWKAGNFDLFFEPELWVRIILRGITRTAFVFIHPDIVSEHFIVGPLTGGASTSILFLLGWAPLIKGLLAREKRMILLFIWFLSCFFFLSAFNTIGARWTHMVPVVPVLAIVMTLGAKQLFGVTKKPVLRLAILVFIMIGVFDNLGRYFLLASQRYHVDFMAFQPLNTMFQFGAR